MASRQTRAKKHHERSTRRQVEADERAAGRGGATEREVEDIEERTVPPTPVIYEIVRRLGAEEMVRPVNSLWWSGVAGGLSISFSLLAQAILREHIPDASWRPLVTSLGYSLGFVMAVLSRQQLFTENTVTVVLPVMADFTPKNLRSLVRMWAVVFLANMAGTLFAALFCIPFLFYTGQLEATPVHDGWPECKVIAKPAPREAIVAAVADLLER
jgi:hypothetical protein